MIDERIVSPQRTEADEQEASAPVSLRPTSLDDFVGQRQVCENLKVFIEAAKKRGELWIMFCCLVLRGWVKQRWRPLLPKNSGSGFGRRLHR